MDTSNWRCHLCSHERCQVLAELTGKDDAPYVAVRCAKCGLVASYPVPDLSPERLGMIYSEDYYRKGWCDGGQSYLDASKVASMEKEARDQLHEIVRITGVSSGRILDIGCSDGRYLLEFKRAGWEVAGVEVSDFSARQAEKRLGISILRIPFEQVDLPGEQFDLIRMKHCIEHLGDPCSAIRSAARLLRPGGCVVIDTDNAEGLRSRLENTIRSMFGRTFSREVVKLITGKNLDQRYGRLSPPIHLYCFSLATITQMLEQAGLEVVYRLRPAQGHPVWFPQLHRYRCNPLEAVFRMIDSFGGLFDRGEVLVVFARKPLSRCE